MPVLGNEEHKQRLNLSSFAGTVVEMDRSVFDESMTRSGFLNRVISAFWEQADASIDVAVAERRHQLQANGFEPDIVERLAKDYRNRLQEKKESYPQGDSVLFRLNNRNFQLLYEQGIEQDNYATPGKYLKALIEEYARLSPSEREAVFFRPLIETVLQPAIDAGSLLVVAIGQKTYWVKPYRLEADPFNSHLYLVGLSRPEGSPDSQSVAASFRITRLGQVRRKAHPSGRLTADDKRDIEKKLQQVGVQYLIGEKDHIVLRLTPQGQQDFLQRSYMRPMPDKVEGDVYHFSCTQMQIRNYFLPFGANVQICQPESLRQQFAEFYTRAAKTYE